MRLALRKPTGASPKNVYASCNAHTCVWYMGFYANTHVFNPNFQTKISLAGQVMMYQRPCPTIVFWLLQSNLSFCVPTHWVSVLGRRSAILHDNRCPLMCEVRGKRWQKYITVFNLGELSYQGSRGGTWNKYISKSYTKSYLRMPCSI